MEDESLIIEDGSLNDENSGNFSGNPENPDNSENPENPENSENTERSDTPENRANVGIVGCAAMRSILKPRLISTLLSIFFTTPWYHNSNLSAFSHNPIFIFP